MDRGELLAPGSDAGPRSRASASEQSVAYRGFIVSAHRPTQHQHQAALVVTTRPEGAEGDGEGGAS